MHLICLTESLQIISLVQVTYVFAAVQINVRVLTMDAELEFAIQNNTTGKQLFDQVCLWMHSVTSVLCSSNLQSCPNEV